ncbi:uncharacterized protein LOC129602713 isoform X2 [Paramacrobiotus metropolitanus]|uniref:uncharacterized protein LOC129602713 isoform X2 n=1 Tax=Paramacrobiotus metropolitanus TaxID=2943436 RepID=UPI0024455E95|nr:uncharacterized protein LOC129602713 isoform X2 [Paramacrobiotus metropolitanus]
MSRTSKDFSYGYQRWFLSFTKTDHHLSASLHLRISPSPNAVTCILDYTIVLLNREHFSRNEIYNAKDAVFTAACAVQSSPNFVGIPDLLSRQFTDDQGEFIIDLILRNPRSFYEDAIQVSPRVKGRPLERLESAYFAFGNLEWNLVLLPNPSGTILKLNRMTHFEHSCQTRFRVSVGPEHGNHFLSGILDSRSDLSGTGESIMAKLALENYVENNVVKVKVEMFSANLLSEIIIPTLHQSVHFYDRDKQGWHVQTYACERGETELLKLKMFYSDVKNVPREMARYVSWRVQVHPTNSPSASKPETLGPFVKYYQQRDVDFSFEISTKASLSQELAAVRARRPSQVENGSSAQSESTLNSYTVIVEWLQLHLLTPANFHHYDDFHRMQYHQMRLELATVQKECYSLERTLLQYQHGVKPQYHPADQDTRSGIELVNGV